jgi:large repetitive protein
MQMLGDVATRAARRTNGRWRRGGVAAALLLGLAITPIAVVLGTSPAGAQNSTSYTPATPTLDTLTSPSTCTANSISTCAPWNEYQGDPGSGATYSSQAPGTVLPVYTPGGATTTNDDGPAEGSCTTAPCPITEPNLSVIPGASSGTDGIAAYPSGVVGTPGPLDGYCGTGSNTQESANDTVSHQPAGTTLPLAPSYFPHVVRESDGTLVGYFDYRPKDADEALMAATSTDGGKDWTYAGEALEQNPGYCPSADINDDGQGHADIITVGGSSYLYTLPRAAGDMQGVGLLIHQFNPTESNPLGSGAQALPSTEEVGIDPDAFVTASSPITVPNSGTTGASIPVTTTGTANSPEQLVTGGFVDLTQFPHPTPSDQMSCTVTLGVNTLTKCLAEGTSSTTDPASLTIEPGDLVEQILGWTTPSSDIGLVVPSGPNTTNGDGGLSSITIDNSAAGGTPDFTNILTGTTFNTNAPNRLYINGTAIYCSQANTNPTTHIEDCTTGANQSSYTISNGSEIFTGDPIVPATAYDPSAGDGMTNGLVAPDGIVGVLPSYPGAPTGSTVVMYTEKELSYFIAAQTTSKTTLNTTSFSMASTPFPYIGQDLPSTGPWTVSVGASAPSPSTATAIVSVTCTGLNETTGAWTGCTAPSANSGWTAASNSYIGAPGATTVSPTTLALTGEGSASNIAKLYKNNEDLSVLRVAYTTDGVNFSTNGLANGGVISDCVTSSGAVESTGCTSPYTGINNPSTNADPTGGLNSYATNEGTPGGSDGNDIGSVSGGDATEMRWVGSSGSIITNPDGSYGLFLSGAWAADGDSDAFNQIFYSQSTNGQVWSTPTPVISTDYSFSASYNQDNNVPNPNGGNYGSQGIGISAYYEGRAYGPSVVQNPNGTLTMVFAGYRFPKAIPSAAGAAIGTGSSQWTLGANDLTMYRNILTTTLTVSTSPSVATTTTLSTPPTSPAVVGQVETVAATVAPQSPGTGTPTGPVTFEGSGGTTLCSATLNDQTPDTATCTYSYSGPTDDSVSAVYGGDTNYATASSSSSPVTVDPDVTTTSTPVATDSGTGDPANPAVVGEQLTLSSTVQVSAPGAGTPTGTVTFADSGATLCTATLGQADPDTASCTYTYSAANTGDDITASYGGDTNDSSSASTALDEVVDVDPTTTSLSISPPSPVVGQSLTFSATVGAAAPGSGTPSGTVTFTGNGGTLCSATLNGQDPDVATCQTSYPATTSDDISAAYGGDTNFAASSASSMVSIGQATTTTTLGASDETPVVGEPVTYTATVAVDPPGGGTPTGTVTFSGASGTLCSGPVTLSSTSPATASCTVTYPGPGSDSVSAAYSGDPNFVGGSSSSTSITIGQDVTTTTVTAIPSTSVVGQPVTLTGVVAVSAPGAGTPTGAVTFTDGAGSCTGPLSGTSPYTATCTVAYASPTLNDTVTGSYSGDTNDAASSGTASETVSKDATATSLTAETASPVVGQPVTYQATVTVNAPGSGTPSGSVAFAGNGGSYCATAPLTAADPQTSPPSWSASCSETYTATTTDSLTATYSGDANDLGSSGTTSTAIGPDTTTTTLSAPSPASPVVGQTVTLSATVAVTAPGAGTPTGTVTFTGNGGTECSATLTTSSPYTASCTTSYPAATSGTVTASYGGDGNDVASSDTTSLSVAKAATTTVAQATPTSAVIGQSVALSATVSVKSPGSGTATGTVTFSDASGTICAAQLADSTSDTASCTTTYTGATMDTVTATYGGDGNFSGSNTSFSITVGKGSTTTTLSSSANPSVTGQSVTFTAEVRPVSPASGTPGGTVTFTFNNGETPTCKNTGDTVTLSGGDATCTVGGLVPGQSPENVHASYSGSSNFSSSTAPTLSQVINKDSVDIALSASADPDTIDQPVTFTASITAAAPGSGTPTQTPTWAITGRGGTSVACKKTATSTSGTTLVATCKVASGQFVPHNAPYSVKVTYPSDRFFSEGSATGTEQVTLAPSSVTLTVQAPTSSGGNGTITATVTGSPSSLGTPTGTVSFNIASAQGQQVTCNSGTNTLTLSSGGAVCKVKGELVQAGSPYTAQATYSGDSVFASSTSSVSDITVP